MARLGRLWRTVRWLRREQLLGRLRLYLPRPVADLSAAPAVRAQAGAWVQPAVRAKSLTGPTRWQLLGEEHDLSKIGWDSPSIALLWRYNQHYFDDLNAIDAQARHHWHRALLQRWCSENPASKGTAWAPFPTSLRIVNWVKWFVGGAQVEPVWLHSLAVQARWLQGRLESHLLGNHLFANVKALVHAGLFFDGPQAQDWLATGLRILQRELPEQILPDGGHFERSTMYHALALEDLLDLVNIINARAAPGCPSRQLLPDLRSRAEGMVHWLRCMRHPAGELARFNDCAEGIAPATDDIMRLAGALGVTSGQPPGAGATHLDASGYLRLASRNAVAFLDLAPVGPDYLPGHAHADTLSFELSVHGRELIVNRGTSVYGLGTRRMWERGTAAHSTVQIGDRDSSEVWSGFRVGRRARPGPVRLEGMSASGSHDGYCHLSGAPVHHRSWRLDPNALLVHDRVDPPPHEPAVARYHLATGLKLRCLDSRHWQVLAADRPFAEIEVLVGCASQSSTNHALCFGMTSEASTLDVALEQGQATVRLHWTP